MWRYRVTCIYTIVPYIFNFIHHKGSDKNNNNKKEKQNNLTKQRNRVTCKILHKFLIIIFTNNTLGNSEANTV